MRVFHLGRGRERMAVLAFCVVCAVLLWCGAELLAVVGACKFNVVFGGVCVVLCEGGA